MSSSITKIIGIAAFFLLIFLTGFWLNRSGKPYNPVLFNVHKLLSLGLIVFLGLMVFRMHQAAPLQVVQQLAIAAAAVCFVITIVTGGLANLDQGVSAIARQVHHVILYLTVICSAGALYLLLSRSMQLT